MVTMTINGKKFDKNGNYKALKDRANLVEGEEYFCIQNNKLQFGTVYICPKCKKFTAVNTVHVFGPNVSEEMVDEAKLIGECSEFFYDEESHTELCETCCP